MQRITRSALPDAPGARSTRALSTVPHPHRAFMNLANSRNSFSSLGQMLKLFKILAVASALQLGKVDGRPTRAPALAKYFRDEGRHSF
jgi:hypothetical protein